MSGADFNAGTLSTIEDCIAKVSRNINRGTLSASSKPSINDVQGWLVEAKQRIQEFHNYDWRSVFVYMDTIANEYRYALPSDFSQGGHVIRDTSNDERLVYIDPVAFDTIYPDVAGSSSSAPEYYTIRDRELWLSSPASGVYRFELWYTRTGDDATPTDISYLPEVVRFKICDYATYRAFLSLQEWDGANAYKASWSEGIGVSKVKDSRKKWAERGYKLRRFVL